jgi:mono/diheme cytochrome c family protein
MSALKLILKILGWIVGIVIIVIIALVGYIQLRWDAKSDRPAPDLKATADSATIARGEYIFKFQAQCWGCHQDPAATSNTIPSSAGGMLFDLSNAGPGFGKWYSRNLTPDTETGIGSWTDGEIVQALREGINKDRLTLFPIMPTDWYKGMGDEDVLAVVAYLRSLQPVKHEVPEREPSFFAKALFTFGMLKPQPHITAPVTAPPRGVTAEYGKYVASNLAGCAECHTPRNLQDGQFYLDSLFAGSSFPFEGAITAFAPNITPDTETGIGSWNEEQFITAVTTGVRPDSVVLSPHMPYAYYKFLTMDDLRAVYVYLKTIPAIKKIVPANEFDSRLKTQHPERGQLLFESRCQACHGKNGGGAYPTNVTLADVAASLTDQELMDFIKSGQMNLKMPLFGHTLKDEEIKDLVAFIRTWGKH